MRQIPVRTITTFGKLATDLRKAKRQKERLRSKLEELLDAGWSVPDRGRFRLLTFLQERPDPGWWERVVGQLVRKAYPQTWQKELKALERGQPRLITRIITAFPVKRF